MNKINNVIFFSVVPVALCSRNTIIINYVSMLEPQYCVRHDVTLLPVFFLFFSIIATQRAMSNHFSDRVPGRKSIIFWAHASRKTGNVQKKIERFKNQEDTRKNRAG